MGIGFGQNEGETSSTPTDVTPDELKGLRGPFVDALTKFFSSGGPQYSGPLVAGMTGGQEDAIRQITAGANDPTRRALLERTMSGGFLPGQGGGGNPFMDAAITAAQRPTTQALEQTLGRTLPGRFAQAGQSTARAGQPGGGGGGSSAFDRAAGTAYGAGADALGDIATKMSFQGYESERGRQQQAIALSQNEMQGLTESLKAQSLPQMINDLGIQRGLAQFKDRTESLLRAIAIAAGSPISQIGNVQRGRQSGYNFSGRFSGNPG